MEKKDRSPVPLLSLLLAASLVLMLVATYRTARLYFFVGDFVVLSSHQECPSRRWCMTHYSVRIPDGTAVDFVPFRDEFNDGALHNGATVAKRDEGFYYEVNGFRERWPFLLKEAGLFLLGCLGLVLFVWRAGPRHLGWARHASRKLPANGRAAASLPALRGPLGRQRRQRTTSREKHRH